MDEIPAEAQYDDGGHNLDAAEGDDPSRRRNHDIGDSRARSRRVGGLDPGNWLGSLLGVGGLLLVLLLHGGVVSQRP